MPKVRIISRIEEPFEDRREAGALLAEELDDLRGENPVILAIPRGGIVVGQEVANRLDGQLDIVLARKIGAPHYPELAIGSVAEGGTTFLNEPIIRELGVSQTYVQRERSEQLEELERRRQYVRKVLPKVPLKGRTVVITDDGIATGATMQVAVWATRQEGPARLIVAVPVASEEAIDRIAQDADEVLCLRLPSYFAAVGQFYVHFGQVEDDDVIRILREEQERHSAKKAT